MSDFDQPDPNARNAPLLGALQRGREHYGRRAWTDAYRSLSLADQATRLEGEDLELLAMAAYLIGRDDDYLKALERAHHAHLDAGAAPARDPLRILARPASALSRRDRPRDRLARACPAAAGARAARVRRAGLSAAAGRGAAARRRRLEAAYATAAERRRDRRALRRRRPDRLRPAPAGSDSYCSRGRSSRGSRCWTKSWSRSPRESCRRS